MTMSVAKYLAVKLLVASSLALTTLGSTGCDGEAPPDASDFRAIGHIDISTVTASPWVKDAMGSGSLDLDADLGACAAMVRAAESVTVGANDDGFEVYVEGKFDTSKADACSDFIDGKVAEAKKKGKSMKMEPEAVLLDKDLFVIHGGAVTPTDARLESLLAADPSPSGTSMWVIAQPDVKKSKQPVQYLRAWANLSKGFDAHAEVQFKDESKATELYGKATLGLAALQLSGEAPELTDGVKIDRAGDTLSADFHADTKTMKKLVADKKKGGPRLKANAELDKEEGENSISISIGGGR